jgi:hypothetical protein
MSCLLISLFVCLWFVVVRPVSAVYQSTMERVMFVFANLDALLVHQKQIAACVFRVTLEILDTVPAPGKTNQRGLLKAEQQRKKKKEKE